jgi:hypothetical protein
MLRLDENDLVRPAVIKEVQKESREDRHVAENEDPYPRLAGDMVRRTVLASILVYVYLLCEGVVFLLIYQVPSCSSLLMALVMATATQRRQDE